MIKNIQKIETGFCQIGRYTFDLKKSLLKYNNNIQKLTPKEADILKLFLENKNTVLTRDFILKTFWDENYKYSLGRSLDVFMSSIRKYLKDDSKISILTIHGIGYKLVI